MASKDRNKRNQRTATKAPDADLELLYKSIRSVYVQEYRSFSVKTQNRDPVAYGLKPIPGFDAGRHPNNGRLHKAIWPQIALFAYKNDVHPYDLIRALFADCVSSPPPPGHFLSQEALNKARRFKKQAYPIFEMELKAAIRKIKVSAATIFRRFNAANYPIDEERAFYKAMTEDNMNPLACILVATEMNFPSLAADFVEIAASIYAGYPEEVDKSFGKLIPDSLRIYTRQHLLKGLANNGSSRSYNELH